jgi:putative ABC transport system permease protein
MNSTIQAIPIANLAVTFVPVVAVLIMLYYWSKEARTSVYGLSRMLVQLLIIGYFLTFLFNSDNAWIISAVLAVMVLVASWIALRTTSLPRKELYFLALASIAFGGGITLLIVTQFVLTLDPWFAPRFMIPLAGMIFGNAMTSVSLAAERLESEIARGTPYLEARSIALKAAMIPITNSLFAVGLVSLPGMMTGQILSGVSPLIAVRYQIMVMAMLFAADGLAAAGFLMLVKPHLAKFKRAG